MQTRAPLITSNPYTPFGLSLSKATWNLAGYQELPCSVTPSKPLTPVIPSAARNLKSLHYMTASYAILSTFFLPLCSLRPLR